jgi:hypothetical protein
MRYLLFQILLFLFFILSYSNYAQNNLRCEYCKEIIKTKFVKVDGKYYHTEHFLCKQCGKPIEGSYDKDNGGYYHHECFAVIAGLFCDYCKNRLDEGYIVSNYKKYHKSCYENYILPKCAICGKSMDDKYIVDCYGNKYHPYHKNEAPTCDCCNRLISQTITHGGKKYADGRSICNICYSSAVFDQREIERLFAKVASKLSDLGIKFNLNNIRILGVDRNALKSNAKNYSNRMQGCCNSETHTKYVDNKLVNRSFTHVIYVLNGVPSLAIESTIAHELMHLWIFENVSKNLPEKICEGSCNYASYIYLKSLNSGSTSDMIKMLELDPNPVYGGGLTQIKSKFESKTVWELLSYLKNY